MALGALATGPNGDIIIVMFNGQVLGFPVCDERISIHSYLLQPVRQINKCCKSDRYTYSTVRGFLGELWLLASFVSARACKFASKWKQTCSYSLPVSGSCH